MVLLLMIAVPLIELFLIIWVAGIIGGWETLLLLILVGIVGGWLVKWQGISTMLRVSNAVSERRVPDKELTDGFLIMVAAILLIIPGFASDIIALFLLFPPTRALVRGPMVKGIQKGPVGSFGTVIGSGGRFVGTFRAETHEVTGRESPRSADSRNDPDDDDPFDATGRELEP